MSLVLNTNIDSMNAQNSLSTSGSELSTALEQLSSGLRINTAADDAAGYAIVQGMTSQINGLNQAAQNANDGVSLAQTGAGALQEVTNDLQTMRDLAVESLNATNSSADRADLNQQFQQLKADVDQVASTTAFNGVNLLDGSFQGATFQVGANAGQTITVSSVASAKSANLGAIYQLAGTAVTAGAYVATAGDTGTFTINGVTTSAVTLTGVQSSDLATVAAAINQVSASDGGVIATVGTTGGINLSSTTTGQTITAVYTPGTGTEGIASFGLAATGTTGTAASYLSTADVSTVDDSNLVLTQIDAALQQVAATGAQLGAYQNRFQAAITGLNTDSTNLSAARSAIQDTDYASATSSLSRAQVLSQAATAIIAQANQLPQQVLKLLQ